MKLYEHEGKTLFARSGIAIPRGEVVSDPATAGKVADRLGYPLAIKGQVLSGSRGKGGGIQFAADAAETKTVVSQLFAMSLGGEAVERLLLEKRLEIARELYAGITFDPQSAMPLLMFSARGGVDIETIAEQEPLAVVKLQLDPLATYRPHQLTALVKKAGLSGPVLVKTAAVLDKLIACYFKYDAITAEINPLVLQADGELCAADAKLEIDDSALYRQPQIQAFERPADMGHPLEREAQSAGVAYVRLKESGNIGLICGGAGLGMATMDAVYHHGGEPANFLDLGHATPAKTAAALRIVLKTPGVKGVFVNAYGGMNNCGEIGQGISQVVDELKPRQAIVVKMRGHSQEEGWGLMAERNIPVVKYGTTGEGIRLLIQSMQARGA